MKPRHLFFPTFSKVKQNLLNEILNQSITREESKIEENLRSSYETLIVKVDNFIFLMIFLWILQKEV